METKDGYLSVIGTNFFPPLSIIYEKITELESHNGNEVQIPVYENGYSVAGIVLSVLFLESYVSRINSILLSRNQIEKFTTGTRLIRSIFENDNLANVVTELYIVRDAIAHNHVWSADIISNEQGLSFDNEPLLLNIYGDKKFKDVVDIDRRKTRILSLNVFPTNIGQEDAISVLENVYEALSFFESIDRNYCYISHCRIHFRNELMPFSDFIGIIRDIKRQSK